MRCPTCGYHSFENMDQCKKCGGDLKEFKAKYGFFERFFSSGRDKALEDSEEEPIAVEEAWESPPAQAPTPSADSDSEDYADHKQLEQDFEEPVKEFEEEALEDLPLSVQEETELADEVEEIWESPPAQAPTPSAGSDSEKYVDHKQLGQDVEEPVKEFEEEALEDLPLSIQEEPGFADEVEETCESRPAQEPTPSAGRDFEEVADSQQLEQNLEEPVYEFVEESSEDLSLPLQEEPKIEEEIGAQPSDVFISSAEREHLLGEREAEKPLGLSREDETLTSETDGDSENSKGDEAFSQELSGEAVKDFEEDFQSFKDTGNGEPKEPEVVPESPALFFAEQEKTAVVEDNPPEVDMLSPVADIAGMEIQIFSRIGAWLADCSILSLILLAFVVLGKIGLGSQPRQGLFPTQAALLVDLLIPYFFLFFSLCFGYFTVFHFLTGQTPGKMLFNIRVEDEKGFPLLFSQAFLRSAGGLLSLLLLGFGYLMIFFDHDGRGWNDRLAGTRTVRAEP